MDKDREWYKSRQGLDSTEAPRAISFCAHAMLSRDVFIVEDALEDERFKDNPMVIGKPYIRFYAGVALYDKMGMNIGVLCIKDTKPRKFSTEDISKLMDLASRAEAEFNK